MNNQQHQMIDKPSQWLNIGYFIVTFLGLIIYPLSIIIMGPITIWKVLVIHNLSWEYTEDSIIQRSGVLNRTTDEIQYFRIKDVHLYEPFLYRFVDLSKLYIITSDISRKIVLIKGIRHGLVKRTMFKNVALKHRRKDGVREFDFR